LGSDLESGSHFDSKHEIFEEKTQRDRRRRRVSRFQKFQEIPSSGDEREERHSKTAISESERSLYIRLDQLIGSQKYYLQSIDPKRVKNSGLKQLNVFLAEYNLSGIGNHPNLRRFNSENALKVMQWMKEEEFSEQQKSFGLSLLLYDSNVIRETFNQISNEWKESPFCLQFIVYSIEKRFGFSGNGVFLTGSDA